jgi:hypothetical protein
MPGSDMTFGKQKLSAAISLLGPKPQNAATTWQNCQINHIGDLIAARTALWFQRPLKSTTRSTE